MYTVHDDFNDDPEIAELMPYTYVLRKVRQCTSVLLLVFNADRRISQ